MIVRKAKIEDASSVTSIQIEAWRQAYSHFIPEQILNRLSYESRSTTWKEIIKNDIGYFRVAESDDAIEGFLHLSTPENNSIELIRLYVKPNKKRTGIGTRLFEDGLSYAMQNKCFKIFLWVADLNLSARAFYEAKGFRLFPDRIRIDSFSIDGTPPLESRKKSGSANKDLGEFKEVYYELDI